MGRLRAQLLEGDATGRGDDAKELVGKGLNKGLEKSAGISRPTILRHIEQSRRSRPEATPQEIIDVLGKRFTAAVAGSGALAGASAAAPGVSTPASLALALAEIHELPVHELERRRTVLLGVLLGDAGANTVQQVAGRTGPHWARSIVKAIPVTRLHQVNKVLGKNFVTKYGTKQGVLVLGKQVPFGIGGLIGGAGNAAFARMTIRSATRAFGPPPAQWPQELDGSPLTEPGPAAGRSVAMASRTVRAPVLDP